MIKLSPLAACAASLWLGIASPGVAQPAETAEAIIAEEQLLGAADEDARARALLPFSRSLSASGVVTGSLGDAAATEGIPASAMLEALRALDAAIAPREPRDGDRFSVRWEQSYSVEGNPIGVGRVLWAQLDLSDGDTVAIHRFRPQFGEEQFFLANGEAAAPSAITLPLDDLNITSRFGRRVDPVAKGSAMGGPLPKARRGTVAKRQGRRLFAPVAPRIRMHEGVDFAVPQGTPVYAASEGVVTGARRNGGYGNWVRVDHGDGVETAYGHLLRFAPNIKTGARVARGQLIGLSGNTGRSTGPHLHFEVISDGQPVDPLDHAGLARLGGEDLERFAQQVAAEERARERERMATK
ncbi:MAG: M23 family metallopeptidase [Enhydrobacter sp.]|nr:M23 family metallopeptidase [Enhydrobacter sp.]